MYCEYLKIVVVERRIFLPQICTEQFSSERSADLTLTIVAEWLLGNRIQQLV